MKRRWIGYGVLLLIVVIWPMEGMSQSDFPTRPVTLLCGHTAGGNTDIGLRILAESASKILGQPVVVENKPGGNSFLAFVTAMNAKPDGYTIADHSSMKYDLTVITEEVPRKVEDATVLGCYFSIVHGVAARADAPWNSFKDLVDYARNHPGEITYGVPNAGAPPHLAMILLGRKEKVQWKAVPYQGLAPAIPALLGGHIHLVAGLAGTQLEQVKAGKMKLLVVTGSTRLPDFPSIPTLIDLGYDIGVSFDIGLCGPKGIPAPALQKLRDAFAKAAKEAKFQKFLTDNSMPFTYMDGDEYLRYLKRNYEERAPLLRELGLAYKK